MMLIQPITKRKIVKFEQFCEVGTTILSFCIMRILASKYGMSLENFLKLPNVNALYADV